MAANKKPRKAYKPKPAVLPMPIRFNAADERELQLIPHIEFAKLKAMTADEPTWHTLVYRLNAGLLLADKHFDADARAVCGFALDSMVSIKERFAKVGKWGANGDELRAIGDALNLVDEMQKASTRRELRDTMKHVIEIAGNEG
jgi:hypothetical protein